MKRFWIGAVLLSMMFAAPAYGQFGEEEGGGTTTGEETGSSSMDDNGGNSHIPSAFTIALVGGVAFPNDVLNFNYFAAKFYLPTGIQIEPFVTLALVSGYQEVDDGTTETRDEDNATAIGVGALARYPLWSKHNVQFLVIGSGDVTYLRTVDDDEGPDNSITTSLTILGIDYGAGVE